MRKPRAPARGSFFSMQQDRTISLIDGYNLYHAIRALRRPELKWLDPITLSQWFLKPQTEILSRVFFFSAKATHLQPSIRARQSQYLQALEIRGVTLVMGQFKNKDRACPACTNRWTGHEEKETDVNIGITLVDLAYQDAYDRAIVITNDSDLTPAIRLVRTRFPKKRITTIVPPNRFHSNELIKVSTDKSKITVSHLERSLLPAQVKDTSGARIIERPLEYAPQSILVM